MGLESSSKQKKINIKHGIHSDAPNKKKNINMRKEIKKKN